MAELTHLTTPVWGRRLNSHAYMLLNSHPHLETLETTLTEKHKTTYFCFTADDSIFGLCSLYIDKYHIYHKATGVSTHHKKIKGKVWIYQRVDSSGEMRHFSPALFSRCIALHFSLVLVWGHKRLTRSVNFINIGSFQYHVCIILTYTHTLQGCTQYLGHMYSLMQSSPPTNMPTLWRLRCILWGWFCHSVDLFKPLFDLFQQGSPFLARPC